ncbi:MAG: rRNA maturation RNAse YbeY [Kiritimatiellae bacterium]|nr:rRNA maturation RNAse YbeY [Kiritimatiellia bacterium]
MEGRPTRPAIRIVRRKTLDAPPSRAVAALAAKLLEAAFAGRADAPGALAIELVGDREMPEAKARVFGLRVQTDVISLRYAPVPGGPPGGEAEIVVNAERARQEGAKRPGGEAKEFALYLAHGIDHLTGADDATPPERRRMRRRELRWLGRFAGEVDALRTGH